MANLKSDEYEALKKSFGALYPLVIIDSEKFSPETHPLRVLKKLEEVSRSNALTGLTMALNDMLEMSLDWSLDKVKRVDGAMKSEGLIPLSELRRRYSRSLVKIAKRGFAKDLEEYYLLKGIVDGRYSEADDIRYFDSMLQDFERKNDGV